MWSAQNRVNDRFVKNCIKQQFTLFTNLFHVLEVKKDKLQL